jgi:hypothetical protein
MTPPPTSIDGTDITGATIDGQEVQEITVDGDTVFTAQTLVDSFDQPLYEDQNKVLSDNYAGDLSVFSRQQNIVKDGTHALECVTTNNTAISSLSRLPNYPSAGDTVSCKVRIGSGSRRCFTHLGVSDDGDGNPLSDGYSFKVSLEENEISIRANANGSKFSTVSTGANINADTWFEQRIEWQTNGNITYDLLNLSGNTLASLSIQDSTYTSGGIGFQGETKTTNEEFYWDSYKIL